MSKPSPSPRPPPDHVPVFSRPLINQCLYYGGTAYFECKVDGYPHPEILWTRRGHPLVDKARSVALIFDQNFQKHSNGSIVPHQCESKKVQVFDTPQVSTVLRSNLMRLYSPVDLTGNLIMIEKLVSGGT